MNVRNLKKMHSEDFEQFKKISGALSAICPAIDDALESEDIDSILSQAEIRVLTSALYRLSKFESFVSSVNHSLDNDGINHCYSMDEQ